MHTQTLPEALLQPCQLTALPTALLTGTMLRQTGSRVGGQSGIIQGTCGDNPRSAPYKGPDLTCCTAGWGWPAKICRLLVSSLLQRGTSFQMCPIAKTSVSDSTRLGSVLSPHNTSSSTTLCLQKEIFSMFPHTCENHRFRQFRTPKVPPNLNYYDCKLISFISQAFN